MAGDSENRAQETELREAEIANARAQAAYYERQTGELEWSQSNRGFAVRFHESLVKNPAMALSALISLIAVIVAVWTSLASFSVNEQRQTDLRFYETISDFGDMESPSVRAGAAGSLGQMGVEHDRFFVPARDQLIGGLRLEQNKIVLDAIHDGLIALSQKNVGGVFDRLAKSNKKLQAAVVDSLARRLAFDGATSYRSVTNQQWQRIAAGTRFSQQDLQQLAGGLGAADGLGARFDRVIENALLESSVLTNGDQSAAHLNAAQELSAATYRLYFSIDLCSAAYRRGPLGANKGNQYELFLVNGNLSKANLRGTNLSKTRLRNARLFGATIDGSTKISEANWWAADFWDNRKNVDTKLLEQLYQRDGTSVPMDLNEVHDSARSFIQSKRQTTK